MKSLIITSSCLRHLAFINRLREEIEINNSIIVSKLNGIDDFRKSELNHFGEGWPRWIERMRPVFCAPKELHSKQIIEKIKRINPDICFVFGAPLLKEEIFSIPKLGCINLHTGLVEHHRGVDSPYWALQEEKPETIGATVHYIDNSIDGGNILLQRQTQGLKVGDSPDDIFMKTCKTGFDLLAENVYNILNNKIESKPLANRGRLYQVKDMSEEVMTEVKEKTKRVLAEFLHGNNS